MQEDIVINDIVVEDAVVVSEVIVAEEISMSTRIGLDGVTFTPHIEEVSSSETILSFTNDGERDNPEPTNIKGEAFTYEDFTPEQITALQQPALDAAVIATNAASSALEAEEIIQDNEDIRIASELSRVSAETIRNNREIIRNNNELGRVSAEESRVTNEGLRASAEEGRANTELIRVSSEQTRALNEISRNNAEILRESNEDTRQENELSRISAENTRGDNEDNRTSAEVIRSSNEVNRINAELLRNSNESTRGTNEGIRQDNEVTRIANENIRIVNEGDETSGRVKAELDRVAAEAVREVIKDSMIELNENPPKLFDISGRLIWHYWDLSTHAYVSSGLSGALNWRGAYVTGSTYIPLDVVSYNESTWLCITESTGNLPTTAYFVPLAKGSYQYWLEAGNTGTYEEYLLWPDSKEDVINKKQTVTNSETDYPSGKAVYDELAALRHDQLRDPNGDPNYQHITTGAQTIAGVKTFSSSPIIPIPTADYQGAPKKYVDDQDALKVSNTTLESTEEVAAEALVLLKNRIDALQKIISDMILGTVQIDSLSIVKTFNLYGSSNLILTGTAAPAIVPDFIGQFFIKTSATTACYQATGNSSVNDWKQIG